MNNTPKLRFKEFSHDWNLQKLGQLGESIIGLTYSPDNIAEEGTLVLRSSNIKDNKIVYLDNVYVNMDIPDKLITIENDVLICSRNGSRALIGKSALIGKDNINNSFGAFMTLFRSDYGAFIFQLIQTTAFFKQIHQNLGATINQITSKDLNNMKFYVPKNEEKEKIASFFSLIDKKIELQTEKVEELKNYKKGIMQKIFSQELRFKDDEGNEFPKWEENKLGDICDITTGKLDANAMVEGGMYRFYTCAKEYFQIDKYAFDTEALLISGNGANVGYIHYYNGKFNAYQRTYVLTNFKENILFIKYYLNKNLKRRILEEKNEGNTPYIVLSTLSDMPVKLPCSDEQEKISQFLTPLELKIEKEEMKLDYYQKYKKGLLQQMFI